MARSSDQTAPQWLGRAKQMAMAFWKRQPSIYRNAIYLTDPRADEQIEAIILSEVWPASVAALSGRRFRPLGTPHPCVQKEWHVNACGSVDIVVEDPERPLSPGAYPPWYARLNIECHVGGIGMIRDYLSVHLPLSTPFARILDLLAETSGGGIPTEMSVSDDPVGKRTLHLVFQNGGRRSGSLPAAPLERIQKKLLAYCDFAEAVYELEGEMGQPVLFRKLIREVNNSFGI
jgi:hypothetical protein